MDGDSEEVESIELKVLEAFEEFANEEKDPFASENEELEEEEKMKAIIDTVEADSIELEGEECVDDNDSKTDLLDAGEGYYSETDDISTTQEHLNTKVIVRIPFAGVYCEIDLHEHEVSVTIGRIFDFLRSEQHSSVFNADGSLTSADGAIYWNGLELLEWTEKTELETQSGCENLFVLMHQLIKETEEEQKEQVINAEPVNREPKREKSLMSRFKSLWTSTTDSSSTSTSGSTSGSVTESSSKSNKSNKSNPSTKSNTNKSTHNNPETPNACLFGRKLKDLQWNEDAEVPEFVFDVLEFLGQDEQIQEGLFRLSGTFSRIQSLQERLDSGERLKDMRLGPTDCHNVTSLLKQFLRRLPEPLLTFELYDAWRALGAWTENPVVSVRIARFLVGCLDLERRGGILRRLMAFLNEKLGDVELTRMNACNFGTVIGPNLLWHPQEERHSKQSSTLGLSLQSSTLASQICTLFLQKYTEIFVEDGSQVGGIYALGRVLYDYYNEGDEERLLIEDEVVFVTGIEDSLDGWWRGYLSSKVAEDNKVVEPEGEEDRVEDEVIEDKVVEDEVIEDEVVEDEVIEDEVVEDEVIDDPEVKFPSNYVRVLFQSVNHARMNK